MFSQIGKISPNLVTLNSNKRALTNVYFEKNEWWLDIENFLKLKKSFHDKNDGHIYVIGQIIETVLWPSTKTRSLWHKYTDRNFVAKWKIGFSWKIEKMSPSEMWNLFCGQSYNCCTIVNYKFRVIIWALL